MSNYGFHAGAGHAEKYKAKQYESYVEELTAGATVSINASDASVFTLTPAQDEAITISGGLDGQRVSLIVTTSGTTSHTLTFGTGFKTTGTLATGVADAKVFTLDLVCNDDTFYETSRTTAM